VLFLQITPILGTTLNSIPVPMSCADLAKRKAGAHPMELLLLLVEQRAAVSREQIVERIWGKMFSRHR
jgi:hypothetical protein